MKELTVFYDGGCPLCRREVGHYRNLVSLEPIRWIDITDSREVVEGYGLTTEVAMRRFHVLDPDGTFRIGAAGFLRLWQGLPGYRYLARLLGYFRMFPLMNFLYEQFAAWHHSRRCSAGACKIEGHGRVMH